MTIFGHELVARENIDEFRARFTQACRRFYQKIFIAFQIRFLLNSEQVSVVANTRDLNSL
jgi:hypothetical protein